MGINMSTGSSRESGLICRRSQMYHKHTICSQDHSPVDTRIQKFHFHTTTYAQPRVSSPAMST